MGVWHNVRVEVKGTTDEQALEEACTACGMNDVVVRKTPRGLVAEGEIRNLTKPGQIAAQIMTEVKQAFRGKHAVVRLYEPAKSLWQRRVLPDGTEHDESRSDS